MKPSTASSTATRFSDPSEHNVIPMEPGGSPRMALASLALAVLLPSLATSIANAALPALAQVFAAPFQAAQWILLAYLLAMTATIVVAGHLGDRVGRRRLFLAGIAIFCAASLLCGFAPTLPLLIAARAIQGVGAAIMMALATALVGDVIPQRRTGRAMGLLGTMSAIGTTLGPALGGILTAMVTPQAIFLVTVPLGVLGFVLAWRSLPADRPLTAQMSSTIDGVGIALLLVLLGSYASAMTLGRGHFGHLNFALLLIALAAGGCFLMIEARTSSPLIQVALLRNPVFRTGLATSALIATVMMATLVVGPFYLSGRLGLDAATVGVVLSAGPLVAALAGVPAGRLVDRLGVDRVGTSGLVAMMVGLAFLGLLRAPSSIAGYVMPIGAVTAGYAMFQAANNTAIMVDAPSAQRGVLSGMLNLARNLGLVTGASAMGAVFAFSAGGDVVTAQPDAIAAGMRTAFGVASVLVGLCLALTVKLRREAASIKPV